MKVVCNENVRITAHLNVFQNYTYKGGEKMNTVIALVMCYIVMILFSFSTGILFIAIDMERCRDVVSVCWLLSLIALFFLSGFVADGVIRVSKVSHEQLALLVFILNIALCVLMIVLGASAANFPAEEKDGEN
jgi:hypothetical protein